MKNLRMFHVTKWSCHLSYTCSIEHMSMLLDNEGTEVDTITVTVPDDVNEENICAFQQIEYYDNFDKMFKYVNVHDGVQAHKALNVIIGRPGVDNESIRIHHFQVSR